MKINFVLPGPSVFPIGGYKMVFEYANRLDERGHEVNVIFNCSTGVKNHPKIPSILKFLYCHIGVWYFPRWFKLHKGVRKICAYHDLVDAGIPDADIICASAISTVKSVMRVGPEKGKKLYFIQDYETWDGMTDDDVQATYRLGMKNIVIAKWLEKIVRASGADCVLIPNGIDFDVFNIDSPIPERKRRVVSMLYNKSEHKGARYGIEALKQLKAKYPDLKAILFGIPKRPKDLPRWIQYVQNATQEQLRNIYNQSQIYLCPSLKEGFGLTGAEAMACGAAYVASDYGGVHEYTVDGRDVLLSKPKDVDGLAAHVSYLFDHEDKRIELAQNGYEDIQCFDWNQSVDKWEKVMEELWA